MQIGFVGLGRMGGNMVERIIRDSDHEVFAFDLGEEAVAAAEDRGATGARTLKELVGAMTAPRAIWVMVPAGDATQATITELAELLDEGDLVIDGGNSRFLDDQRNAKTLEAKQIDYLDIGTSGGVWGLEVGYCMMVGGSDAAVERMTPILDVLAPAHDDEHGPGWNHFGAVGAGHYVKMVHNGIEYGMMQAYAEGFALLDASEFEVDNAALAHLWMRGSVIRSWLCELAANAFEAEGNDLANLEPWVDDSGEGRWTLEEALDRRIPMPALSASLFARFSSRGQFNYGNKFNAALRNQFGGHPMKTKQAAHK